MFVENPGYSNLLSLIRHHGCIPIGIRRDENGLDVEGLLEKAILHQPKIMFVNTVLQNPLGTSLSQSHAHRLLALAEQFDFWLVEDDIYRELCPRPEHLWRQWMAYGALYESVVFKNSVSHAKGWFGLCVSISDR